MNDRPKRNSIGLLRRIRTLFHRRHEAESRALALPPPCQLRIPYLA